MSTASDCPDTGRLRALIDGQLGDDERVIVEKHLTLCPACRQCAQEMAARAADVSALMALSVPPAANVDEAWRRFQGRIATPERGSLKWRFTAMWRSLSSRARTPALAVASVAVIAAVALVPPLRTAAAGMLDVFRVQQVKVISFNPEAATALSSFQDKLFSRTEIEAVEDIPVTTAEEASLLTGYPVLVPGWVPDGFTLKEFVVTPQRFASAEVNIPAIRSLLELAGLPTDALPTDPDDASISAVVPPVAMMRYANAYDAITVYQAASPEVSMPQDLDLTRLGSLGLQLLGMWPEEADRVSASIDWANTLVIPLPTDASQAREITVHGLPGYMLERSETNDEGAAIWQEGSILYAVSGDVRESQLQQVAESLQ